MNPIRQRSPKDNAPRDGISVDEHDFDYGILETVQHRPWPMPAAPWMMTQTWHDLLFAHWAVDKDLLAARIPRPLELDLYRGDAWLGIVPFHMTNVAPRAIPALPWVSAFPELNVRTYVRIGDKPGVYFFSLDAGNPLAVGLGRTMFNLPYYWASMDVNEIDGALRYRSRRTTEAGAVAEFVSTYRPAGPIFHPHRESLEYFLTERYCLYTVDRLRRAQRLDIHHSPWPLQPADATFLSNTMAEANRIALPPGLPLLHFAKRQDIVAWLPTAAD